MKVCIDPGHGMSNSKPGIYDPGCMVTVEGESLREADIVLKYAHMLKQKLGKDGHDVFMTRENGHTDTPLHLRTKAAEDAGCDLFISLHLNAFEDSSAHGVETYYGRQHAETFARLVQDELVRASGLRDRGVNYNERFAVVKFKGVAALLELGFLTNKHDRTVLLNADYQERIIDGIARAVDTLWHAGIPKEEKKVKEVRKLVPTEDDITARTFRRFMGVPATIVRAGLNFKTRRGMKLTGNTGSTNEKEATGGSDDGDIQSTT